MLRMFKSRIALLATILFASAALAATTTTPVKAATVATPSATLVWTPATTNTDGTAITGAPTYNIYQGAAGSLAKVQTGVTTATAVITTGLTPGASICFAVTEVVAGVESAQSPQACATIPVPTPGAPTQLTVVIAGS